MHWIRYIKEECRKRLKDKVASSFCEIYIKGYFSQIKLYSVTKDALQDCPSNRELVIVVFTYPFQITLFSGKKELRSSECRWKVKAMHLKIYQEAKSSAKTSHSFHVKHIHHFLPYFLLTRKNCQGDFPSFYCFPFYFK